MPDEMNLNQLRAYADGELTSEEAQRIDELLSRDERWRNALTLERRLRARVNLAMQQAAAPELLRERVVSAMRAETEVHTNSRHQLTGASAGPNRNEPRVVRPSLIAAIIAMFSRHHRMNISLPAVVLTLVFVAAIVLFGIFGRPIDHQDPTQPVPRAMLLSAAAAHVSQEHDRCADSEEALLSKVVAVDRANAAAWLQNHLGTDATIFDLSDLGYRFVGVGHCSMPGSERSAHLMYRREVQGEPRSMMSIFVVRNDGQFPARCRSTMASEGRWSGICGGKGCTKTILHGSDDQLVYFLACGFADQVQLVSQSICKGLARRGR